MRTVSLLGSTGSIGTQAVDVLLGQPERFRVVALAAQSSTELLLSQAAQLRPDMVVIGEESLYRTVRQGVPAGTDVLVGTPGLVAAASAADVVLNAVVGFAGLPVTMAALEAGKRLALANKESLIAGAPVVQKARRTPGAEIVPVDSEHCAIHQCLATVDGPTTVARLLLTASGGPFRGWTAAQLATVTVDDALAHPTWRMGPKITIDSSTLMNKGLEVIEASRFFDLPGDRIHVLVHRTSVAHGFALFTDGNVIGQFAPPDMRLPIGYALAYPDRLADRPLLDPLEALGGERGAPMTSLVFQRPDLERFPCLRLAYEALARGGTVPAALSAANEIAVAAFVDNKLRFGEIPDCIESALAGVREEEPTLNAIRAADGAARLAAQRFVDARVTGAQSTT